MRRVPLVLLMLTVVSGMFVTSVVAQEETSSDEPSLLASLGYPEIRATSDGVNHDFPTELEAGRYHVVLQNESEMVVALEFILLPEGVTTDDVLADFAEAEESGIFVPENYFYDTVWNGGVRAMPGETGSVVLDLAPGEWHVNHFVVDPETDEGSDTPTPFTVTGEMPAVEEPADAIEIGMIEMDFDAPETLGAGPQIWKVVNNGLQVHHLVLSRVPDGTTEDQVLQLFAGSASPVAESALSFEDVQDVFDTPLIARSQFNLYEVDLEPGTYTMVCFMPDPTGTPHVMLGMVEVVVVE